MMVLKYLLTFVIGLNGYWGVRIAMSDCSRNDLLTMCRIGICICTFNVVALTVVLFVS